MTDETLHPKPMSRLGSHKDKPGTKVTNSKIGMHTKNKIGSRGRTISRIGMPLILEVTNRLTAIGGVIEPMPTATKRIQPS